MYTLTIIRLNVLTNRFENTETHGVVTLKTIENELIRICADFGYFDRVVSMGKGDSITLQVCDLKSAWFVYVCKF